MDTFKEFLETSTIHGLVYISTSRTKVLKATWVIIVLVAFITALNLINNSYIEWDKDPVSTTISTKPIHLLPFPNVTVCPPEGYNTALNYDLLESSKATLTQNDIDEMKTSARKVFMMEPYDDFLELIEAVVNPENLQMVYRGLQTVPIPNPYSTDGFLVECRAPNGSISTPWFGEKDAFDPIYYQANHTNMYVLNMQHYDMSNWTGGNLSLVVELEVDTRRDNYNGVEWKETITVTSKGAAKTFKWFPKLMTWNGAKQFCEGQIGGSFASILSETEQKAVEMKVPTLGGYSDDPQESWLGGQMSVDETGNLTWEDGSSASFSKFHNWINLDAYCPVSISHYINDGIKHWKLSNCNTDETKLPFVCQFQSFDLVGTTSKILSFPMDLTSRGGGQKGQQIKVMWDYKFTGVDLLDGWQQDRRMTGFRMKWHIEDTQGALWTGTQQYKNVDYNIDKLTQLASTQNNSEINNILLRFREEKIKSIDNEGSWYTACKGETFNMNDPILRSSEVAMKVGISRQNASVLAQLEDRYIESGCGGAMTMTMTETMAAMEPCNAEWIQKNPSNAAISNGLKLLYTILYCSKEGIEMYKFHKEMANEGAPTIIQTTMNNVIASKFASDINLKSVNRFYRVLEKKFNLQLGKIVLALSSKAKLKTLLHRRVPYLAQFHDTIQDCLKKRDCNATDVIIQSLPGESSK
jgi:hypothetical protein